MSIPTEFQLPEEIRTFYKDSTLITNFTFWIDNDMIQSCYRTERYLYRRVGIKAAQVKVSAIIIQRQQL